MKFTRQQTILFISSMVIAAIVILLWGATTSAAKAFDDAYITYRYADNFRNGLGLVYNPNEWVLGTTTPLFALLLGLFGFFFTDIELLGHWLSVFSWVVAAWAAGGIFRQEKRPFAAIIAPLFIAVQPSMLNVVGMETILVVALMLTSAWAWLGKKTILTVFLLAALIVTRADGVLWATVIGLEVWRRDSRLPWRVTTFTILLAAPWFLYAQWRYGSFLSNSVAAKTGQTVHMAVGGEATFIRGFMELWNWMPVIVLFIFGLLILMGLWIIVKDARKLWYLPVWILLYLAFYTMLGVANFSWYYVPPTIILLLVSVIGAGGLLGDGLLFTENKQKLLALRISTIAISLMLMFVWFIQSKIIQEYTGYKATYPLIGNWLNEHTREDARAATIEIGVIGYLSERPILDTMGLVSPELTQRQVGWIETLTYTVSQLWPEYAVVLEDTAWDWVIGQWWFYDYYEPVANFDNATIYQLQGRPVSSYQVQSNTIYPVGFSLTGAEFSTQQLQLGAMLDVWLQMETYQNQTANYQLTAYLINTQTDERTAITTVDPLDGGYNTSVWQRGDKLALPLRLQIPNKLTSGVYRLGIFIYDLESGTGLPTTTTPTGSYPEVELGWLRHGNPEASANNALVPQSVQAMWQEGIVLEEIALPTDAVVPGGLLPIGFQWYTTQTPARNLTIFVHLINETGDILAQLDQRPFTGQFPTAGWQPNERLNDQMQIQLPSDLPSGMYGLRIGLYDENGRLPRVNGDGDYLQLSNLIQIDQKIP